MNGKTVFGNFIWRLMERIGAQAVTLIVSIVLARILDPSVYGSVALITVFTTILQVFVDSGLATALIQKKDADDLDFSTVFYFNISICIILYVGMFFAAPFIARFYNNNELIPYIRVLSLVLLISGVKNVQQAYVSRNMLFKKFFYATLAGTIGAAIIGIVMAYKGMGAWALITQNLFNQLVDTIILWIVVKWRPQKQFSFLRLKQLFSFGSKVLGASLVTKAYEEIRQLIIGKKYSKEDLAFFNRGIQFPYAIVNNINTSIESVLLPSVSAEQDNIQRVKSMTRRAIKVSTYFMAPIMIGLAVIAEPFIALVLGEKWLPCVPYLRIYCIIYIFYPINTANLNAIKAVGKSEVFLKLEIIKKLMGLLILIIAVPHGVIAIAYSLLVSEFINLFIDAWPNKNFLKYSIKEQILDMTSNVLLALLMGGVVWSIQLLNLNSIVTMLIQAILGCVVYICLSKAIHLEVFAYSVEMLKQIIKRKNVL